jgi:TonB family protein
MNKQTGFPFRTARGSSERHGCQKTSTLAHPRRPGSLFVSACALAIWSALLCAQGMAQQPTQATPQAATSASAPANCAPPTDAEVQEWMGLNKEVFEETFSPGRIKEAVELGTKLRPDIPAEYWKRWGQLVTSDKYRESARASMASIIQRHFCSEDIKQYNAFYGSPVGRKFHAEILVVMDEWGKAAKDYAATLVAAKGEPITAAAPKQGSTAGESAQPSAPLASAPANCAPPSTTEVQEWMGMSQEMIKNMWSRRVKQFFEDLPKLHPEVSSEEWARLEKTLMSDKVRENMFAQMVPVVQRHFCAGDIKQYMAFDGSPAGRKFHAEMPAVMNEWGEALKDNAARLVAAEEESKQGSTAGEPARPSAPSAATPTPQSNPQASGTKRIQVTQEVSQGLLVHKVQPTYPPLARQARIQGSVVLQALIGKDGTVEKLAVVSGHPMLVGTAIEAVKQWEYKPYIYEGQPVEVETVIVVNFEFQ